MSSLATSLSTSVSLAPPFISKSTSFSMGGESFIGASLASLHCPFSSSSMVFSPLLVTPSLNLGVSGLSLLPGHLTPSRPPHSPVVGIKCLGGYENGIIYYDHIPLIEREGTYSVSDPPHDEHKVDCFIYSFEDGQEDELAN
jgi:hypothetical protein